LSIEAEENIGDMEIFKDNNSDGVIDETMAPDYLLGSEEAGDLAAPETRMSVNGGETNDGDEFFAPITVEFLVEDDLSGVLKTEYAINGTSSWQTYDEGNDPVLTTPGEYTIYYFSTDRAGNGEEIKSIKFYIQEKDCLASLKNLVNDLYAKGKIKKTAVKNLLMLEFDKLEKLIEKYVDYDKNCHKNHTCGKIKNRIDKAVPKLFDVIVRLIQEELNLYVRLGWITKEASDIIKDRLQCVYNYFN
jgi:hypothetical protein